MAKMFCVGIAIFFLVCLIFHFRFWGRHLASLYPLFLLLVIGFLSTNLSIFKNTFIPCLLLCILIAIWSLSSIRLTYLSKYEKDDYRSAVSYAINSASSSGSILWAADRHSANYYGLIFFDESPKNNFSRSTTIPRIASYAVDWDQEKITNALQNNQYPIVIVISKPDLYDKFGSLTKAVEEINAELIATPNTFKIYKISLLSQR